MSKINKDQIWLFYENDIEVATKTLYLGYGQEEEFDIDQVAAGNIIKGLRILSSFRPDDPINIIVNCQGGEVQHGFAIYDAINMVESPVYMTVIGHCYSMAAWILQAGDRRRMSKNSSIMIHHGDGPRDKFSKEQDRKCIEILLERIREKHPGYSEAKLDKLLLKDTYMWPEEALELGLIDEIV